MNGSVDTLLGLASTDLLELIDEGVIIMDARRQLRHVNRRARQLLGFSEDEPIEGRCRHTTRGVDCEAACPLSYALSTGQRSVQGFRTAYRRKDESLVSLSVSVVVVYDADGGFAGAAEILKPAAPDPGATCAGPSATAQRLRQQLTELARHATVVTVVGESMACVDVARALHRVAELRSELFRVWCPAIQTSESSTFPPGTLYVDREADPTVRDPQQWPGWRVVYGARTPEDVVDGSAVLEAPSVGERVVDLPFIVSAMAKQQSPNETLSGQELERLAQVALTDGYDAVHRQLAMAMATRDRGEKAAEAGNPLESLLTAADPLAAVEECVLREVLIRCGWRVQEAADQLGVSRVTLWRKLKEHSIERPG